MRTTGSVAGTSEREVVHVGRAEGAGRAGRAVAGLVLLAVVVALSGCVADDDAPTESPAATTSADATSTPTPTAAPVLLPAGTAAENKPFFDYLNQALVESNPAAGGVDFTSNLRTNGFDIAAMQVTPDTTTVGVAADSIQFSVKWGEDCLIGQYGQGAYTSVVAPALGTGTCLIGETRPIDW